MRLLKILMCGAVLMVSAQTHAISASSEGVSRQVSALNSAMRSFKTVTEARAAAIETDLSNYKATTNAHINNLTNQINAHNVCANRSKLYAPNDADADGNGCITASAGTVEKPNCTSTQRYVLNASTGNLECRNTSTGTGSGTSCNGPGQFYALNTRTGRVECRTERR